MTRPISFWKPLATGLLSLSVYLPGLSASADNAVPQIEDPIILSGTVKKLEPKVPVGKTLMIPIPASDADGDALSYKVTSSNPKIMARIRTGRPHLKLTVTYPGTAAIPATDTTPEQPASEPFEGELDFQIFRDWTPETASYIAGFAQSLFYSPSGTGSTAKHTIFHRVIKDFMCQTGDPNGQFPDPDGDPIPEALDRGPGFSFDDEFGVPMIFSGRGQLAMANAGYDGDYRGTNGSQFFVTTGSPRHLDFNHTIFGQLVRGWDLLDKMQNVPVTKQFIDPRNKTAEREVSRPQAEIRITQTKVEPNFTDGLVVLSATGTGESVITVTAMDGKGGEKQITFNVTAFADTQNSPPWFSRKPVDRVTAANKPVGFGYVAKDLEQDYFQYATGVIDSSANATAQLSGNRTIVTPKKNYVGPVNVAYGVVQFDMAATSGRSYDELRAVRIGFGEKPLFVTPLPITGAPGQTLSTVPIGRFLDTDARGLSGSQSVRINWGDGTTIEPGVLGRDPTRPSLGGYQIFGSHVYAGPGVYPVVVTFNSAGGLRQTMRTLAVISNKDVRVFPEDYSIPSRTVNNRRLAQIRDFGTQAAPNSYEVTLDWGDGVVTPGQVQTTGTKELWITGSHTYRDPDTYSVAIRVHKKGTAAGDDAFGWSNMDMNFLATEQFLPPYPMAHLVASIGTLTDNKGTPTPTDDVEKPFRSFIGTGDARQAVLTFGLSLLNGGNKKSNPSKVRFYLSTDRKLNLEDETYTDDSGETPVQRTNPKDRPLTVGTSQKEIDLIALNPGKGGTLPFDLSGGRDNRIYLPKGETGIGQYLLVALVYDDALAKLSPIAREAIADVAPITTPVPAAIDVTETAGPQHSKPFAIQFEQRPKSDVTIPLSIVNASGVADTSEIYFNQALPVPPTDNPGLPPDQNLASSPDLTITYTQAMWDAGTKQIVVPVTAKQDSLKDGDQKVYVRVGPVSSLDPRYHNKLGTPVTINVIDRDSVITVSPTSLVTTEASGTGHQKNVIIRMLKKPLADVVVPIVNASSTEGGNSNPPGATGDPSEGVVSAEPGILTDLDGKPSLVFTASENYPASRTITVTSIDDLEADGNVIYTITVGPTTSTDPDFNGINPPDITVTNIDNPPATTP